MMLLRKGKFKSSKVNAKNKLPPFLTTTGEFK
jgi:hypothetical protein